MSSWVDVRLFVFYLSHGLVRVCETLVKQRKTRPGIFTVSILKRTCEGVSRLGVEGSCSHIIFFKNTFSWVYTFFFLKITIDQMVSTILNFETALTNGVVRAVTKSAVWFRVLMWA